MSASLIVANGTAAGAILLLALVLARGLRPRVMHTVAVLFAAITAVVALQGRITPVAVAQSIEVPAEALQTPPWFAIVWIATAAFLLLRDTAGLFALARHKRWWNTIEYDGGTVSTSVDGAPMTVGFLRPVVFIPRRTFEEMPAGAVRTIVRHERDHQRWHDPLTHFVVRLLRIALWPILPMWVFEFVICRAAEEAADAAALRDGADPLSYAGSLVTVATWTSSAQIGTSSVASGALERRIERMLRPPNGNAFTTAFRSAVLFTAAVLAGCLPRVVPEQMGNVSIVTWSIAEPAVHAAGGGGAPQRPPQNKRAVTRRVVREALPISRVAVGSFVPRVPAVEHPPSQPPPSVRTAAPIAVRVAPPPVRIRNVIRVVN